MVAKICQAKESREVRRSSTRTRSVNRSISSKTSRWETGRSSSSISRSNRQLTYTELRRHKCHLNLRSRIWTRARCTSRWNESLSSILTYRTLQVKRFIVFHPTCSNSRSDITSSPARIHKPPYNSSIRYRTQVSQRYRTTPRLRSHQHCKGTQTQRRTRCGTRVKKS